MNISVKKYYVNELPRNLFFTFNKEDIEDFDIDMNDINFWISENLCDILSDEFGYCVYNFKFKLVDVEKDRFTVQVLSVNWDTSN